MILIKNGTLYDAVTPEAQRADILVGDDGKITAIAMIVNDETPESGGAAIETLTKQIIEGQTLAVDTISKEYRLVGDLRFAKYVRFLLDEFTPLHDELCFEEGRLMKAHATGDPDAAKGLEFVAGRMQKMYNKYFALEA